MRKLALNRTVSMTLSTMLFFIGAAAGAQEVWKPEVDLMKFTARQVGRDCGFNCIELQIYNNSESQAIVVDAGNAECENQHAVLSRDVLSAVDEGEQHKRKQKRALVSIATAGLACMLVAEHDEKKNGSLAWLVKQTKDRELRCQIFERRVIGPGDNTSGRIYFKDRPPDTATLKLPAMFVSQYGESNQIMTVSLSQTTINPERSESILDVKDKAKR